MSRGIKMRKAVGTHGTLHRLADLQKRHDAQQTLPTLLCDGCNVPVRFVPAHDRSGADGALPAAVPAYIALNKGAEHLPGCRYNARSHLQALLASGTDPEFLPALGDGRHELRLLILQQALKRGNAGPTPLPADAPFDGHLRTLNDLLILQAMCEDDTLLTAQLTLRLGKKRVDWANFLYGQDRYDEAWERLGSASSELPLALLGTVRSHRTPQPGDPHRVTFLNCAPKYQHTGVTDRRDFYEVSVGHTDTAWLKSFPVGAEIVMFGLWRQGRSSTASRPHPTDPRRTITSITHKLALRPSFTGQLRVVE
ncbi:hypothetical protein [Stenotrophomonas rhizophila]|uniref:Uncharacterized protein n=1 Tax=Stenotrophomonas rhizophila TaxID=216778 RepID=A0A7V7YJI6_9GAMM|nr:hypothetical protein [Stenotrophomonas rhizophila]KAB7632298.1 hypothetical protein F9K92_03555 [Stenotrophomonas rhizophila]